MANIDDPAPLVFKDIHINGAMELVKEAGWNQLPDDWQLMANFGKAVILQDKEKAIYATALALPYSTGFGWVSMVLVSKAMRRKGIATHLLADRIAWLRQRNLVPILDATEDGEQVYKKLGFINGIKITRWQGVGQEFKQGQKSSIEQNSVRIATEDSHDWIRQLEADVFGADRSVLIDDFLNRPKSMCFVTTDSQSGFVIIRQGNRASQIGPLVAESEHDAKQLLNAALDAIEGPVFFDLQNNRTNLTSHVVKMGFEKQRSFQRMSLGNMPDFDGNGRAMIIAGPEYG